MEYTRLGNTGLKVSRLTLGCMSFGDHRGFNEWSLNEEAAEAFFRQAFDLGITFWDTVNVYQLGSSEEYVGRAIKKLTRREDVVLATKLRFKMHDGPGRRGPVPQGGHGADRRLADPVGHRLRRPLPDPPIRRGNPWSPRLAASPWPRLRWPGCSATRPSPPPSSGPRSRTT
jgi:aryl-alcohol dehydrogenase-like predicted oxidoreductase